MLAQPYVVVPEPRPGGLPDMLMHLGDDHTGRALEVGDVELADGTGVLVIHVMDLRKKYRGLYERGKQQTEDGGQQ
ncbi:hypothetical protein [Allosaccharopolyspora coralli]|uniref:hypothetical protein n=1 Tax=Allosaccharopolyspora coralli TaxID=2665642 RepID=UPI00165287A7|nr:hypothetical protein [Allosaccharopolyspora coralli]